MRITTYLEATTKRAVASACDWPGWCRVGKTEDAAIAAMLAYAPRYAAVVSVAGLELPTNLDVDVVERKPGDATTDYGVPGQVWTRRHCRQRARRERAAWTC